MSDIDSVVVKALDPTRVAVVCEPVEGFEVELDPIFGRLYSLLLGELARLGVAPTGPAYGIFGERTDGRIDVIAGVVIADDVSFESAIVSTRNLPGAERAATLVHRGSREAGIRSYAALGGWIEAAGERPVGLCREVYLACPIDRDDWITELQFVLA